MRTRARIAGVSVLLAGITMVSPVAAFAADGAPAPDAAAQIAPTPGGVEPPPLNAVVCDTYGHYQVKSRNNDYFLGLSDTATYVNKTPNQQTFSKTLTATGSYSLSLSVTAGIDAGAVLGGIKLSASASATATVSGTSTQTGNMVVSPYKTGELRAGIGRVITSGQYTQYYSNCDVKVSKSLSATAPTGWTWVAREY